MSKSYELLIGAFIIQILWIASVYYGAYQIFHSFWPTFFLGGSFMYLSEIVELLRKGKQ